eukprot:3493572-Rhodomonas_salina.1
MFYHDSPILAGTERERDLSPPLENARDPYTCTVGTVTWGCRSGIQWCTQVGIGIPRISNSRIVPTRLKRSRNNGILPTASSTGEFLPVRLYYGPVPPVEILFVAAAATEYSKFSGAGESFGDIHRKSDSVTGTWGAEAGECQRPSTSIMILGSEP